MRPLDLPNSLVLPVSVAHAQAEGVSRGRLRASDLRSPFHGVRTRVRPGDARETSEESVRRRTREYATRMRDAEFFCLTAAAVEWDLPLPRSAFGHFDSMAGWIENALDVGVILPARAPRGRGARPRSVQSGLVRVVTHPASGLRISDPASTWAMLGSRLSADDLIVLGDAIVRKPMRHGDPPALASLDDLRRALAAGRRGGASRLREAVDLIRTRSLSPQETRSRLQLMDAGLPEPELNWPVVVDETTVALIDLAYPELLIGFEYEGEQHLTDPAQWARDIRRYELLASLGWRILRVTKDDLKNRTLAARASAVLRSVASNGRLPGAEPTT